MVLMVAPISQRNFSTISFRLLITFVTISRSDCGHDVTGGQGE
jgi:hypothetical protein